MNRNTKLAICIIVIFLVLGCIVGFSLKYNRSSEDDEKLTIVATTFSTYDFA